MIERHRGETVVPRLNSKLQGVVGVCMRNDNMKNPVKTFEVIMFLGMASQQVHAFHGVVLGPRFLQLSAP